MMYSIDQSEQGLVILSPGLFDEEVVAFVGGNSYEVMRGCWRHVSGVKCQLIHREESELYMWDMNAFWLPGNEEADVTPLPFRVKKHILDRVELWIIKKTGCFCSEDLNVFQKANQ